METYTPERIIIFAPEGSAELSAFPVRGRTPRDS